MAVRRFIVRMARTSMSGLEVLWSMTIPAWMVLFGFMNTMRRMLRCDWPAVTIESFPCALRFVDLNLVYNDLVFIEVINRFVR